MHLCVCGIWIFFLRIIIHPSRVWEQSAVLLHLLLCQNSCQGIIYLFSVGQTKHTLAGVSSDAARGGSAADDRFHIKRRWQNSWSAHRFSLCVVGKCKCSHLWPHLIAPPPAQLLPADLHEDGADCLRGPIRHPHHGLRAAAQQLQMWTQRHGTVQHGVTCDSPCWVWDQNTTV